MRRYEITKLEKHYITAESVDQAIEIVKGLNSSKADIEYLPTWIGPEVSS